MPHTFRQGITATDVLDAETLITAARGNPEDLVWVFNKVSGSYEAFEMAIRPNKLRAIYNFRTGEWKAPP